MDNQQVSAALAEIGILMELLGENPFKVNAYVNASRTIGQLTDEIASYVNKGTLGEIAGIGATLQEKITSLVKTGKLEFLEELRAKVPPGLVKMLAIQGVGPKKVKALYDQLQIDSLEKLKIACDEGKVAALKGFGAKTQQKILEGIEFLGSVAGRVRLDEANSVANTLLNLLKDMNEVIRMEVCGSLRRRKETVKDIDLLVSSNTPGPIMEKFVSAPGVIQVLGHGETKSSIFVEALVNGSKIKMQADLRVVKDEEFPFALAYFTGSKEHNVAMRSRAIEYGLKLNEYGLTGEKKNIACKTEEDIYKALDLPYIAPELREDTGEINAALKGTLPTLVESKQIQGVFHNHTTYSDGANTLEEMANKAQSLGLKYLGFGDHSQSLTVANGLSPERVKKQIAEIDELNSKMKGFRIFKGIECDILADGSLDYDDEVLALFDYVVGSVHTHFQMNREEMTQRIIKAMNHPAITMLGHLTGRLVLRRDGYAVNQEAVLQEAVKTKTLIEINAHPMRLDLDWIHCKRAKELGVKLVINPDAHSTGDLEYYEYGVSVARRGWLEKDEVFNTLGTKEVEAYFSERRKAFTKKK